MVAVDVVVVEVVVVLVVVVSTGASVGFGGIKQQVTKKINHLN